MIDSSAEFTPPGGPRGNDVWSDLLSARALAELVCPRSLSAQREKSIAISGLKCFD